MVPVGNMFLLVALFLGVWLDSQCVAAQEGSIDNIISEAANSTNEFEFFYDLGQRDVRIELDLLYSAEKWGERQDGLDPQKRGMTKRQAIKHGSGGYRWTNNVVPYEIAGGTFSSANQGQIRAALADWSRYTCLTFRRASGDRNKIRFQNGGGCYSRVGMVGGTQEIGLAGGCRIKRIIIHEVGHALGLQHEQTRPDRDNHVTIMSRNIAPAMLYNFQRYTWRTIENYNIPYDYYSIMHYGKTAFTVNGGVTIRTSDQRFQNIIGNQGGLSFRDIKTMNLMHPCTKPASCTKSKSDCPSEGFLGKDCRCWCPGSPYKICDGTTGGGGGATTVRPTGTTVAPRTTTRGTGGGTNNCQDQNSHCRSWQRRGECNRNPSYMHNYCKRSCGKCSGTTTNTCKDLHRYCNYWARNRFCTSRSYATYMRSNCRRSCNMCSTTASPTASCFDRDTRGHCQSWADIGECDNNRAYMHPNCRKSCGLCTVASAESSGGGVAAATTAAPAVATCRDANALCPYWATTANQCRLNPNYMLLHCRRSCNWCGYTAAATATGNAGYYYPYRTNANSGYYYTYQGKK